MDQAREFAQSTADNAGIGPNDSSTVEGAQQYLNKGIEAVQKSVFGQSGNQQQTEDKVEHDPAVSKAVDELHPAAVEDFQRHEHRSDPVTDSADN